MCLGLNDMRIHSAVNLANEQMVLDIENENPCEVCMDAVYGEWKESILSICIWKDWKAMGRSYFGIKHI